MFEKIVSSIGINGVLVDTIIDRPSYSPGEQINGSIKIVGGIADQEISGILLTLIATFKKEPIDSDFSSYDEELEKILFKEVIIVRAGEEVIKPYEINLSNEHPISSSTVNSFLKTKVLVENGVDPSDYDEIIIC
ncbi:sporulation protein [Jeotgalibacillus soli]|uniref:Sporulation protein n=1 Tax=Jeotgalibacillus soli TaxID=889306 RepID=A0A0C2R525_9BACL|nr:sporulation protein [Jeotgalibacillus soli]KIL45360.1 hypothetical protein KP78_29040 [Jeotgalibacillus soli]